MLVGEWANRYRDGGIAVRADWKRISHETSRGSTSSGSQIILVEATDHLLGLECRLGPRMKPRKTLAAKRVGVMTGSSIASVSEEGVRLNSGEFIATHAP